MTEEGKKPSLATMFGVAPNPASQKLGGKLARRGQQASDDVSHERVTTGGSAAPGQASNGVAEASVAVVDVADGAAVQAKPRVTARQRGGAVADAQPAEGGRAQPTSEALDEEDEEDGDGAYLLDIGDASTDSTVQVSVYLTKSARTKARWVVRQRKITNAALALQALTALQSRLKTLLAVSQVADQADTSAFPARTGRLARVLTRGADRRPLWTLQATPAEILVMDEWVVLYGAASRSELVAVAMEEYLADVQLPQRVA